MSYQGRPERDTPRLEQRELRDERDRLWIGSVTSGTLEGGEEHAEVIFVCPAQPSELKRVARLDTPPAEADDRWRRMNDRELLDVFEQAEPA